VIRQALIKMAVPAAGQLRKLTPSARVFFVVLHVVIVLAVLAVLIYVGFLPVFDKIIPGQWFIRRAWLAILGLILYLMYWVIVWLWRETEAVDYDEFPDQTRAWGEAMASLARAGVDVSDVPLFLVLGEPGHGERTLFSGTSFAMLAAPSPIGEDAPLRVYGVRDGSDRPAVFVTCAGASTLGWHARHLASRPLAGFGAQNPAAPPGGVGATIGGWVGNSMSMTSSTYGQPLGGPEEVVRSLVGNTMAGLNAQQIRSMAAAVDNPQAWQSLLRDRDLMKSLTARLRHLCRLIARDRSPRCPANGLLVVLPYTTLGDPDDSVYGPQTAADTGVICRTDLAAVCETFRLHVPVFALISDLEKAPGSREFLKIWSSEERLRMRFGESVKLCPRFQVDSPPDKQAGQAAAMLRSLADWICGPLLARCLFKGYAVEAASGVPTLAEVESHNARLFQFYDALRRRKTAIAGILTDVLVGPAGQPPLPLRFGGLYLSATGQRTEERAFYRAVLEKLIDNEDYVCWTDEVFAEEASRRRQAWLYGGLALWIAVLDVLIIAALVFYAANKWPR
jgi:hypothetical protein